MSGYSGSIEHLLGISTGIHQPPKEIIREMTRKELLGKDTDRRLCSPLRKSASTGTDPRKGHLAARKPKIQHFCSSLSTTLQITWAHLRHPQLKTGPAPPFQIPTSGLCKLRAEMNGRKCLKQGTDRKTDVRSKIPCEMDQEALSNISLAT